MGYKEVKMKNSNLTIRKITDDAFKTYGAIHNYEVSKVIQYMEQHVEIPTVGNTYSASEIGLESQPIIQKISKDLFGHLLTEAGPCVGHNKSLTGIEYHQGSEINIAITDCVLILGKRQDMVGNTYDGGKTEVFYVEKGQTVELYDTTLHYTPCKVDDHFATVVILLKGTNEPIDEPEGILMKKNKWFITHTSMTEKIKAGNYPGVLGDMVEIM